MRHLFALPLPWRPLWVRRGAPQAQTHWKRGPVASATAGVHVQMQLDGDDVSAPPPRSSRWSCSRWKLYACSEGLSFQATSQPFPSSCWPNSSDHSSVWQATGRDVCLKACPYIFQVSFVTCAFTTGKFRSLKRLTMPPLRRN